MRATPRASKTPHALRCRSGNRRGRRSSVSVERPNPICKTVSAAPPAVDRHLADLASEAADGNARLPRLLGAVNRLARQATEIDAHWSLLRHRGPAWKWQFRAVRSSPVKLGCICRRRKPSRWKGKFHLVISRQLLVQACQRPLAVNAVRQSVEVSTRLRLTRPSVDRVQPG